MRKAFTLVEVLLVVTIVPFVLVAISGVYATFIRDIPRTTRVLQQNATVLDLLQQMRRDMDGAVGLPEQFDDRHAGESTLLIAQAVGVICYQWRDGQVVRTVLGGQISPDRGRMAQERVWRAPDAVIAWDRWMRNDKPYAIEIRSYLKQWVSGFLREKLANSNVFFIGGLAKEGEIQ
jgi:prepilin-type N-terminal cleavage/methylation domain-containing protein